MFMKLTKESFPNVNDEGKSIELIALISGFKASDYFQSGAIDQLRSVK
jgi:hypothetical protein